MVFARVSAGLLVTLLFVVGTQARAGAIVPPFDNFPQAEPCQDNGVPCGWFVGSPGSPIPVEFDPLAPAWIKTLEVDKFEDNVYFVSETLEVVGADWNDWHEEIMDANWEWDPNPADAATLSVGGIQVGSVFLSPDHKVLDFTGFTASATDIVTIMKTVLFTGGGNAPLGLTFDVEEFPTQLPVPGA